MAIELKNVFEKYEIELILAGKTIRESFEVLHDISFSVKQGEAMAIMGPNGAGKTTLLRLIAGLLAPEKGEVKVHGRVGSLLDLGAGFHPELTGRDNLLLNASLYHFSREELNKKFEDILRFADIGKFIDTPVRCYSAGMYVRLAFSLAIHVDPDIILIDDCLSVGDDSFRLKCVDKVLELKSKHKTIVLVTHSLDLAKQICSKGIYLRNSRIVREGTLDDIEDYYLRPVQVDAKLYQYLGAKILEEENRKLEEERRRREEEERRRIEEEERRKQEEEHERRRREEELQRREEEEAQRKEADERRMRQEEELRKREEEHERRRREEELRKREEEELRRREEEFRKREEEEPRRREEELRRREEEFRKREEEELRRREEAEELLRKEEEKRLLEKEKRKQDHVLFCGPFSKWVINSRKVKIIHHDVELTSRYGVRTHFLADGRHCHSHEAVWRIKRISDAEIFCCLKWKEPKTVFQTWHFKSFDDGTMNLEITMRPASTLSVENELMEFCLQAPCEIFSEDRFHNKARTFCCGSQADFTIETLREDQIIGTFMEEENRSRAYFLTISERSVSQKHAKRRLYFKGKFSSGVKPTAAKNPSLPSHHLKSGKGKIEFCDGSCQLFWKGEPLTTGLGIYTSLYSRGNWYDSAQARWKVRVVSRGSFIAKGFWPWLPIAQTWEISLTNDAMIHWRVQMEVFGEVPVHIQETVMMMSPQYKKWSAGPEIKEFPEEATQDDFFRVSLCVQKADGVSRVSAHSDHLPAVTFKPVAMSGHRIIVENSEHIYGLKSRLFHCLRANKKQELFLLPGTHDFFQGTVHLKEEHA